MGNSSSYRTARDAERASQTYGFPSSGRIHHGAAKGTIVDVRDIDDVNSKEMGSQACADTQGLLSYLRTGIRWLFMRGASKGHWKPITLSGYVLSGFVAFSMVAIILLEVLAYKSSAAVNGGGLVFAKSVDGFSPSITFIYLYLPIVIAVIYSMLWSWVDLDAKRLEPWFQLSNRNGATAENSVLLQYPFDFLPFVPFAAFRRRHWCVFFSGTIMLLTFWLITPLQAAIFNTNSVIRSFSTEMVSTASLISLDSQSLKMNSNFLNRAYGITWLNQTLPSYSTSDLVTIPFGPFDPAHHYEWGLLSEIWKTTTLAYRTNITCKPANVKFDPKGFQAYTFDNGEGCITGMNLPSGGDYLVMYVGWDSDAEVSYALASPTCSKEHSHNFLALYATKASMVSNTSSRNEYGDLQAHFCTPQYSTEEYQIIVNGTNGAVIDATPTGTTFDTPLSTVFNTSLFHYVIGAGINPEVRRLSTTTNRYANLPDDLTLQQYPRVGHLGVQTTLNNMVGFALGLNPLPIEKLADPLILERTFERAHQLLFTSAFSLLLDFNTLADLNTKRNGRLEDQPVAIVLVRTIAIVVEVGFGIIAILATALWWISAHRTSNLGSDPSSVAAVMSLVTPNNHLSKLMDDDGTVTSDKMDNALYSQKFCLLARPKAQSIIEHMPQEGPIDTSSVNISVERKEPQVDILAVRPLEHRLYFGVLFSGVLLIALGALIFLETWAAKKNGILLPSQNPVFRSIIQNYLPTAFATLLEPMWVILSRWLCLLQPFGVLKTGNARPSKSLNLRYMSLPPQLAVWRAIRARHFVLALVCFVTVSSNLLAVTLAGLLNEGLAVSVMNYPSIQPYLPEFNNTNTYRPLFSNTNAYRDHYYAAMSNFTYDSPLPSWVDRQYFYLPFELATTADSRSMNDGAQPSVFPAPTFGIRSKTKCSTLVPQSAANSTDDIINFNISPTNSSLSITTSHVQPNKSRTQCRLQSGLNKINSTSFGMELGPEASAIEFLEKLQALDGEEEHFCDNIFLLGWGRIAAEVQNDQERPLQSTFVGCRSIIQVATFNVTVNSEGQIIHTNRTSDFWEDDSKIFAGVNATSRSLLGVSASGIVSNAAGRGYMQWHNDSFTSDWFNSLLMAHTQSDHLFPLVSGANFTHLVDPRAPLPKASVLAASVEALYDQLFALLLALNPDGYFMHQSESVPITAEVHTQVTKIFVSPIMFKLSVALLALHFCTAVAYYVFRPKKFLTRMPTTIASVIAYVSSSRALQDFAPGGQGPAEGQRYGFGRFVGTDGKTHVGIEQMRYVVPLKAKNPRAALKPWWRGGLRWRRTKHDQGEVRAWI